MIKEDILACAVDTCALTETGWAQSFIFPDDFGAFDGHFPGQPILPGVVQTLAAFTAIESQHGAPFKLRSIRKAKFAKQINPDERILVAWVKLESANGSLEYKATLTRGDETVSSFILIVENTA